MLKKGASKLFFIVFLLYTVAPPMLLLVDDSIDVSIVFSTSEEEEEAEKHIDIEILFSAARWHELDLMFVTPSENSLGYSYKKYPKPHLSIICPPPDLMPS